MLLPFDHRDWHSNIIYSKHSISKHNFQKYNAVMFIIVMESNKIAKYKQTDSNTARV